MRYKALILLAALPLTVAGLSPVRAAPQILGLIASTRPIPMTCVKGTCVAELSSVCLQQHRPTPDTGTVYRPAHNTQITLAVTGPDGVTRRLRVEAALSYVSLRQFSAVKVSLREAMVRRLGSGPAMLSVSPMASLVPVATEGDPDPLSAGEIARYTGPLRSLAERAFERDSNRVNATRILNQMVNRLPENSGAGIEEVDPLRKLTVSEQTSPETQAFLTRAIENCRETLRTGVQANLPACLRYQHDYLSGENTTNAWRAMNPGS